ERVHGMPPWWSRCGYWALHPPEKNVYLDHRRYLDRAHPYGRNQVAFNAQVDHRPAPIRVSATDFLKRAEEQEEWLRTRLADARNDKEDPVHMHG
ncbi:unnamed protein product, partial [Sphagnum compactum]